MPDLVVPVLSGILAGSSEPFIEAVVEDFAEEPLFGSESGCSCSLLVCAGGFSPSTIPSSQLAYASSKFDLPITDLAVAGLMPGLPRW